MSTRRTRSTAATARTAAVPAPPAQATVDVVRQRLGAAGTSSSAASAGSVGVAAAGSAGVDGAGDADGFAVADAVADGVAGGGREPGRTSAGLVPTFRSATKFVTELAVPHLGSFLLSQVRHGQRFAPLLKVCCSPLRYSSTQPPVSASEVWMPRTMWFQELTAIARDHG